MIETGLKEKISEEVTLLEVLDAREKRVIKQRELLSKHNCPLICFTMNIAGPIKTSMLIERAFKYGLDRLDKALNGIETAEKITEYTKCGPVCFIAVRLEASRLKAICSSIEEECPLGRLFDMDVLDRDGKKLDRVTERCCIVCGKQGRTCAAGRLHSVEELTEVTNRLMTEHFAERDCEKIGQLAKKSLIDEVETTPKPGLVDKANNGSHRDMTLDTFKNSANALLPYFTRCVKIGMECQKDTYESCFKKLREAGINAEKAMLEATNGVNTHKGIIYSMGVLLGAVGRLWRPEKPVAHINAIFDECAKLTSDSVRRDFEEISGKTAGERLYLINGERGIRGEVADGFPSVKNIALPVYSKCIQEGMTQNDAGVITLLHLISQIYDTSVFNRGGEEGVAYVKAKATEALAEIFTEEQPIPVSHRCDFASVKKLDELFIAKNLSSGGAADLLAITYLLASLKTV